jgi:curved DNA-binding protein CbpA
MVRQQSSTLYDVLGVSEHATLLEIRAAFRKLTLQHHPDRFTGVQREQAEEKFQIITEAFNVLSRTDSREKYDREISQGGAAETMDRREIARRLAAKGAQALRDGKLAEALQSLEAAVDHDDECGRAHFFLGLAKGQSPQRQREALRHLERATQLEPNNAAIKAEAASVALAAGMKNRAQRMAREALDLDPTNGKATEVLAKTEAPEEAESEGLFGRLRRKG